MKSTSSSIWRSGHIFFFILAWIIIRRCDYYVFYSSNVVVPFSSFLVICAIHSTYFFSQFCHIFFQIDKFYQFNANASPPTFSSNCSTINLNAPFLTLLSLLRIDLNCVKITRLFRYSPTHASTITLNSRNLVMVATPALTRSFLVRHNAYKTFSLVFDLAVLRKYIWTLQETERTIKRGETIKTSQEAKSYLPLADYLPASGRRCHCGWLPD